MLNTNRRRWSFFCFVLACLLFALAWYLFSEYMLWVGFWDGYVSELDRAQETLATWFVWFSLATGMWFLVLGALSFRTDIRKAVVVTSVLVLLAAAVTVAIDLHYRTYMMDSAGG